MLPGWLIIGASFLEDRGYRGSDRRPIRSGRRPSPCRENPALVGAGAAFFLLKKSHSEDEEDGTEVTAEDEGHAAPLRDHAGQKRRHQGDGGQHIGVDRLDEIIPRPV